MQPLMQREEAKTGWFEERLGLSSVREFLAH